MSDAVFPVWPVDIDEPAAEQPRDDDAAAGSTEPSAAAATTAKAIARLLASVLGPAALPPAEGADLQAPGPGAAGGGHRTLN